MNNQVNLIGRIGKAPQLLTFTGSENKVAKFSLAVKEYSLKNENTEPLWINVDAWNSVADLVMATITVGREVAITGRLAISEYEKEINGVTVKMQRPVVKLTGFHLCGAKPKEEKDAPPAEKQTRRRKSAA